MKTIKDFYDDLRILVENSNSQGELVKKLEVYCKENKGKGNTMYYYQNHFAIEINGGLWFNINGHFRIDYIYFRPDWSRRWISIFNPPENTWNERNKWKLSTLDWIDKNSIYVKDFYFKTIRFEHWIDVFYPKRWWMPIRSKWRRKLMII